jgi:hypothetical protein
MKISVKDEVLALLRSKEWVSVDDFERIFPPKTEGHLSWGQRKRELHKEYTILKRRKENCKNTWEYHLVENEPPRTELEEMTAQANLTEETRINEKAVDRLAFEKNGQLAWLG